MRGTRTTIAGIVCHQVNHGFAGEPWLRIQDKESPAGARLSYDHRKKQEGIH